MVVKTCPSLLKNEESGIEGIEDSKCLEVLVMGCFLSLPLQVKNWDIDKYDLCSDKYYLEDLHLRNPPAFTALT